jgi:hypothetical protein
MLVHWITILWTTRSLWSRIHVHWLVRCPKHPHLDHGRVEITQLLLPATADPTGCAFPITERRSSPSLCSIRWHAKHFYQKRTRCRERDRQPRSSVPPHLTEAAVRSEISSTGACGQAGGYCTDLGSRCLAVHRGTSCWPRSVWATSSPGRWWTPGWEDPIPGTSVESVVYEYICCGRGMQCWHR